jgi:hypothetical protein
LGGQRLVDGIGDQPDIDQPPDGEYVAGRSELHVETVGDLSGVLPIERQSIGQDIDNKSHQDRYGYRDLADGIFHRSTTLISRIAYLRPCKNEATPKRAFIRPDLLPS